MEKIVCPSCGEEVEVTMIRTNERVSYKYVQFTKAVGICPNCISEIHIPEIDELVNSFKILNKKYATILNQYKNTSDGNRDSDFAKDWLTIPVEDLLFSDTDEFENDFINHLEYYGTLKTTLGFDVVTLDQRYLVYFNALCDSIKDDESLNGKYSCKVYTEVSGEPKEVCMMLWKDIANNISGIIFDVTDISAYRYGKQKSKNKTII